MYVIYEKKKLTNQSNKPAKIDCSCESKTFFILDADKTMVRNMSYMFTNLKLKICSQ